MFMKTLKSVVVALLATLSLSAFAGANDPLFVSLTSDEPHRATMAFGFGTHMNEAGHPLSVFLSDKGVFLGVKSGADKYPDQQKMLANIIAKGGTVIMCPMCLKHYGFTEADLLPGIKMGGAKVTGEALFKDNTKTMTW
ncbi:DsrE family protein [Polynucleobacter sp. es-MAR-4]|jgi:predicted peroxiredoxin|uniref:DsrE family protein n=1 Tax=Polynucleobacter sp. es-MAR-4 TaxID=1855655 RepID=UPI001C0BB254|nr:DsrE family protein [Polynucleobacter sp. es-MAR-4]